MILSKEIQENAVNEYLKNNSVEKTQAFIDGMNKVFELIKKVELEQITDDFTVAFLEWLNENSIYYPKNKTYFFNNEWHSQEETFKHFKNNIYGK
jgi:hypothetical protein